MSEEKITGVCVDIPTLIKEAKRVKLLEEAIKAAKIAIPQMYHWSNQLENERDIKRQGYVQAYMDLKLPPK